MKEFKTTENLEEKIKVTSLEIIVTGSKEKPYFEIKYKELGKEDYDIGYSSYDLNNVFTWKDECFDIVNELAEEYKEECNLDCDKLLFAYSDLLRRFQNAEGTVICEFSGNISKETEELEAECEELLSQFKEILYSANTPQKSAEEYKGGWIPCSKEMPKAGTHRDVWISLENEVVSYRARWYLDHFEWDNGFAIKERIVAWMPNDVPEPYMEGESGLYRAKSVDGEYQEYNGDWK